MSPILVAGRLSHIVLEYLKLFLIEIQLRRNGGQVDGETGVKVRHGPGHVSDPLEDDVVSVGLGQLTVEHYQE